jgi:hypothetical protein
MDKELQKFYEEAFSMMATLGWKDFMEDIQKVKTNYNDLSTVADTQELYFRKGQLDILNWLLGLKGSYEKTYEDLQHGSEDI